MNLLDETNERAACFAQQTIRLSLLICIASKLFMLTADIYIYHCLLSIFRSARRLKIGTLTHAHLEMTEILSLKDSIFEFDFLNIEKQRDKGLITPLSNKKTEIDLSISNKTIDEFENKYIEALKDG